jgi:transposase-like protein
MKREKRQRRVFSDAVKKKVVKDIEDGKASIASVCREFSVSDVSVYNWLHKYSHYLQKGVKLVVEQQSEVYRSKELERELKEVQAALGKKQLQVEFLEMLLDVASKELGTDIKKNYSSRLSMHSRISRPKKDSK